MKLHSQRTLDERGFTLVEVLGALTILAVISVTIIGYFVTAMDRSEEESKRIIAANLSRSKAAEIRDTAKVIANYDALSTSIGDPITGPGIMVFNEVNPFPLSGVSLTDTVVNQTNYAYEVTFNKVHNRSSWLSTNMGAGAISFSNNYLIHMNVKVFWDEGTASKITSLDSYIVRGM